MDNLAQNQQKKPFNWELVRIILDLVLIIGIVTLAFVIIKNQQGWNLAIGSKTILKEMYQRLTEQGCIFLT